MPARVFKYGVPPQRVRTFLLLFASALTIPLLALAAYGLNRIADFEQADLERRVIQVAEDIARDVDREIDRATAILDTLSSSLTLRRGEFSSFDAQAKAALKHTNAAIVLIDRSFQQLTSTMRDFGAELPKTADIATAARTFDTKQRQISDLFKGSVDGRPVFNIEVPVVVDDSVPYVLIMSFRASHIASLIRRPALGGEWINGVTDNNGIILARSERHEEFVGKPLPSELLARSRSEKSVYRSKSVTGIDIVRATVRSTNAGWLVSATVPVAYVEMPRKRGNILAVGLLVLALGLGLALAYIFGGFMARPLAAATVAASELGAGKQIEPLHSPLAEANALTAALSNASIELRRREEHAEFLLRELAHRSKNQLAVVRGIASQTMHQSKSTDQFLKDFNRRLHGLSETQDVMLRQNWQGAWISDLVEAHLKVFGAASRVATSGPPLFLDANAVQNVGYALHELATNASKHGAFRTSDGSITIGWDRHENRVLLSWSETSTDLSPPKQSTGFGSLVLTQLMPRSLQGRASLEISSSGCFWTLEFPASHVVTDTPAKKS